MYEIDPDLVWDDSVQRKQEAEELLRLERQKHQMKPLEQNEHRLA